MTEKGRPPRHVERYYPSVVRERQDSEIRGCYSGCGSMFLYSLNDFVTSVVFNNVGLH